MEVLLCIRVDVKQLILTTHQIFPQMFYAELEMRYIIIAIIVSLCLQVHGQQQGEVVPFKTAAIYLLLVIIAVSVVSLYSKLHCS